MIGHCIDSHAEHRDPQVAQILGDAAPIVGAELEALWRRATRSADKSAQQWAFLNSELGLALRLVDRIDADFPVGDPAREVQRDAALRLLARRVADWREYRDAWVAKARQHANRGRVAA